MREYPVSYTHLDVYKRQKLARAVGRAAKARQCAVNQDTRGAFDWWRLLYDDRFPTYYY